MKRWIAALLLNLLQLFTMSALGSGNALPFDRNHDGNIYLLRGLTRESGHWGQEFLDELQQAYPHACIHLLDLPGSGRHYQVQCPVSVGAMVEFMRAEVAADIEAGKGTNLVMATSLGSMVVTEWAIRYPDDFQAMVLISPSFKGTCKMNERMRPGIWKEVLQVPMSLSLEKKEARLLRINSNDTANFQQTLRQWIAIQQAHPMTTSNILRQTLAGMLYKPSGTMPTMPVLILASRSDRLLDCDCVEKVHTMLGGVLVWNETSGHGLPIDAPEWLVEQVAGWSDGYFNMDGLYPIYSMK
jgi:pimeloyl-ACP methyl ester carboxylesterase